MHGDRDDSRTAKLFFAFLNALGVSVSAWILFASGAPDFFRWTHRPFLAANALYESLVMACAAVYCARIFFGLAYLYRRAVRWNEAAGVGISIIVIQAVFAFFARTSPIPPPWLLALAIALYILGSSVNTASEYLRNQWKKYPANQGHLYTKGIFRYSRHVNYFGDELLFTGYALIAGGLWPLVIPAFMAGGFIFGNIPMLDAYLQKKYGAEFEVFARTTKKFIPFVY